MEGFGGGPEGAGAVAGAAAVAGGAGSGGGAGAGAAAVVAVAGGGGAGGAESAGRSVVTTQPTNKIDMASRPYPNKSFVRITRRTFPGACSRASRGRTSPRD